METFISWYQVEDYALIEILIIQSYDHDIQDLG